MREKPDLVILGGPNGSGKSSVYKQIISLIPQYNINADEIAKSRVNSGDLNSVDEKTRNKINVEAAKEADRLRTKAIEERRSFTTESVMSTDKGLNIMNAANNNGFHVQLIYILTTDPEINIKRIQNRVAKGGHPVPAEKVISRYERCMKLLPQEICIADTVRVFDNSFTEPCLIIEKTQDKEIKLYPQEHASGWTREQLEEIKAEVEEISRRAERTYYPDETVQINRLQVTTLCPAQRDRVYSGEITDIQNNSVIQEISPGVVVEHSGIAASMSREDIGQRFTIAYDCESVSITKERQRDHGHEIDR